MLEYEYNQVCLDFFALGERLRWHRQMRFKVLPLGMKEISHPILEKIASQKEKEYNFKLLKR